MKQSFRVRVARQSVLLLALVLAVLGVQAQPTPIDGVYTCTDAAGRKLRSDRPIPECSDREQQILNPSGTVKSRIGPTLTAQERFKKEEQEKLAAEEKARQIEEKRRDRALLVRYPNRGVHDGERAQALEQIGVVVKAANTRLAELRRQRADIDAEMEFYKKDPAKAPNSIRRQIDDTDQSQAIQKRFVSDQESEMKRVNARFDEELDRLKSMWAAAGQAAGATKP
jgi:hypothetical protein